MNRRPEPVVEPQSFTTEAQARYRRGGRRRLVLAAVTAVVALLLLVWLGPRDSVIVRRLTYYGAPGELRIMPEISIDQGAAAEHRLPRSLQMPPPPARLEIVPERRDDRALETVPKAREAIDRVGETVKDPAEAIVDALFDEQVELLLPQQTSTDWYILRLVRPVYPVLASEQDRRRPVINVVAWIFVDPQGNVTAAQVISNEGGDVFAQAVLEAIRQWKLAWRVEEPKGRQLVLTWRFRSPKFSARRP